MCITCQRSGALRAHIFHWTRVSLRVCWRCSSARACCASVVFYIASTRRQDLAYLKELIEAGLLRAAIDRTYTLEEGREAVRYAMSGQARAKVVIAVRS